MYECGEKMSLNHEGHNSPKRENYLNGSIDDFTDCIDFTNQYQKSCSVAENEVESAYQSSASPNTDKDYFTSESKCNDFDKTGQGSKTEEKKVSSSNEDASDVHLSSPQAGTTDFDDSHPMEPDVSITVGVSNLEKTINHVAKGVEIQDSKVLEKQVNGSVKSKLMKKKSVYGKKNHLKLPVNRNIKKKVSLLKYKTGKHMKQKNDTFQYQGLHSNIKFKCYKCSVSDFSSISELQTHQRKCISSSQEFQSIHESTSSFSNQTNPTNFKITRKVYLCSACGSYYENWNLFLHMKEMHKRHICLYCLGMFSQPDKLAQHLITKHNVVEQNLSSTEDFFKLYRGTCYLICCSCETMFSEQEEFYEHSCSPYSITEEQGVCPLCGLQGSHYPTCRRAFTDRRNEIGTNKSHAALEKRFYNKKRKLKTSKKSKNVFRIINNENGGEMSVTVRKQNAGEESSNGSRGKDQSDNLITSPVGLSNEDLASSKQYNEKMLQLYRPNKPTEKVISSIQSIEESINRVVENLGAYNDDEEEEDEDNYDDFEDNATDDVTSVNPANSKVEEEVHPVSSPGKDEVKPLEPSPGIMKDETEKGDGDNLEGSRNDFDDRNLSKKDDVLSDNDSTDSEKLTIAFDQPYESGNDKLDENKTETEADVSQDVVPTAGADTPYVYVTLKEDCNDDKALIKELVKESSWNCVYCAHAKRIAVNGKQLSLHILAEHRFVTCPEDSTEEEKNTSALTIVERLKTNLERLEHCYFNTDTFDSEDKGIWKANDRIYECFHCLFATYVHKELYSHNRKMHQKAVFLCIMCKSNFYNYSELLCHLCPGIYIPGQVINPDITYRCFLCNVDPLPSSFRLMVHLRRRHNSCDICFDQSTNQFQLSTHVWKHKLSHMCYRCGIAYRNKPDITKHLFWKHGTESVLCKKCLQKKWPHVYHFCVPPLSFICDECSFSLKSAVALKVHKRLHSGECPYPCDKCEEKFISRKLLAKHMDKHNEEKVRAEAPELPDAEKEEEETPAEEAKVEDQEVNGKESEKKQEKEKKSKKRKVLTDVFDLPPVNLSESDDSDQDVVSEPKIVKEKTPELEEPPVANGYLNGELQKEETTTTQIVDGVWNNFKNYMDRKEFPKTFRPASPFKNMSLSRIKAIMLSDHDYHIIPNSNQQDLNAKVEGEKQGGSREKVGLDHDYCNNNNNNNGNSKSNKSKLKTKHKEEGSKSSSSESSSDSDSSCSCGSNCSCSSGSSSSTSSNESDSDSREKRKERKKVSKEAKTTTKVEPEPTPDIDVSVHDVSNENTIRESDLETEETETDEDFYDYNPAREANRILAEKRTQLLANLNGSDTFASSPSTPTEKPQAPKKKSKIKKKRSQSRVSAGPKTVRKKSTAPPPTANNSLPGANGTEVHSEANGIYDPGVRVQHEDGLQIAGENDAKRPKRKRVPLKFYGFSSDEESDAVATPRKREKNDQATTTTAAAAAGTAVGSTACEPSGDGTQWTSQGKSSLSWRVEKSDSVQQKVNPIKIRTSQTMKQNSEVVHVRRPEKNAIHVNGSSGIGTSGVSAVGTGQKGEKLYCFCQCPYDEVSEMIACDAEDCVIEWFHFECVGIMVPPKGSWYCPDCRKKLAAENEFMSPPLNEQSAN